MMMCTFDHVVMCACAPAFRFFFLRSCVRTAVERLVDMFGWEHGGAESSSGGSRMARGALPPPPPLLQALPRGRRQTQKTQFQEQAGIACKKNMGGQGCCEGMYDDMERHKLCQKVLICRRQQGDQACYHAPCAESNSCGPQTTVSTPESTTIVIPFECSYQSYMPRLQLTSKEAFAMFSFAKQIWASLK